jgi:hypothetical protein
LEVWWRDGNKDSLQEAKQRIEMMRLNGTVRFFLITGVEAPVLVIAV